MPASLRDVVYASLAVDRAERIQQRVHSLLCYKVSPVSKDSICPYPSGPSVQFSIGIVLSNMRCPCCPRGRARHQGGLERDGDTTGKPDPESARGHFSVTITLQMVMPSQLRSRIQSCRPRRISPADYKSSRARPQDDFEDDDDCTIVSEPIEND